MTSIRSGGVQPNHTPVCLSDASLMVQALASDLEEREVDERADARDCLRGQLAASQDEVREMRREARLAVAGGVLNGVSQIAQAGVSTAGASEGGDRGTNTRASGDATATSGSTTTTNTSNSRLDQSIAGSSTINGAILGGLEKRASADQAAARLEASVHEQARESAKDSADGLRESLERLRATAAEIARLQAETMSRILA